MDFKNHQRKLVKSKGFTLIELMIVIAIIGILSSIAIPQYQSYTRESLATAALSEVKGYMSQIGICAQMNTIQDCEPGNPTSNLIPALHTGGKVKVGDNYNGTKGELDVSPGGVFGDQKATFTSDESGTVWELTCIKDDSRGEKNNLCKTKAIKEHPYYKS